MKTKIFKLLFSILVCATIMWGCSKNFLDMSPYGTVATSSFYKTDADATNGIAAVYNYMDALYSSVWSSLWMFKETLSDEIYSGGQNEGDQAAYTQLGAYIFDPTNSIITNNFQYLYAVIQRCNILINNLPGTTPYQQVVMGEAKCIRAYCYLELVSLWGPVPLVTTPVGLANQAQPNSTLPALYAQIDQDCADAIKALPVKSQLAANGSDISRVSKGTAEAIQGKARLYNGQWAAAITAFTPILPGGADVDQYGLYQLTDVKGDLTQILRTSTNWGKESLWELDWSDVRAQGWSNSYGDIWNNPSRTNPSNIITQLCGPRGDEGFSGGTKTYLINGGWGFGYPSLQSAKPFGYLGDTIRRNASIATRAQILAAGGQMGNLSVTGDTMNGMYDCPGLIRLKYTTWQDETQGEPELNYETHVRLIRYADVLLMAAEAYVQSNQTAQALPFINAVRNRANLPSLTSVAMSDIKMERRVEMAYEGTRFQDLLRWGDAPTVLASQGSAIPSGIIVNYKSAHPDTITQNFNGGFKPYNILLPIPQQEINGNSAIKQNAGYTTTVGK